MPKRQRSRSRRATRPTSVKASAKKYFTTVAKRWDRMREDFFDETIADSVLKASDLKRGDSVVDIGCGTGFLTQHVVMRTQGTGKIIGVDLSPSMLEAAKDNLAKLGLLGSVEFRIGDAEKLPLDDSFADAVVGNMILHHCPRPRRAISEMTRVLKNGGRVALADLERHNERWLRREMADRWLGFDLTKVKKWFEEAGLQDVRVELARTKCCGISMRGRKAQIGIFIASGSKPQSHPAP